MNRAFGDRLKAAREAMGFDTASDFARKIGVERLTYYRWERGETKPADLEHLARIRNVTGKSLDWLLLGIRD
ncbi:helix-turn-helix transcriptional regulator [Minwuia sp.]|uniref:helix-turn-helix transcriptional regulator n=1 Tax=Minwuia sp. TaxID=2493630 RepID=UPI003A9579FC